MIRRFVKHCTSGIRENGEFVGLCIAIFIHYPFRNSINSYACYIRQFDDMTSFVNEIIAKGIRVLLYYGEDDTVCDFYMGEQFSKDLALPLVEEKTPWYANHRLAGFKTVYEELTFITVHGAGHMV